MVFSPHPGSRTRSRDHRSGGIRLLRRCFISKGGPNRRLPWTDNRTGTGSQKKQLAKGMGAHRPTLKGKRACRRRNRPGSSHHRPGVLLHGRINAYFDTRSGPFQITKPPLGEQHPRGFVQSTVLKTITEHPQGMTTAEIITELSPHGIGQESIANALDVLVQAKKNSSPGREGKYLPAASEVPTAPDQPSP
jgi:hypothetical protein